MFPRPIYLILLAQIVFLPLLPNNVAVVNAFTSSSSVLTSSSKRHVPTVIVRTMVPRFDPSTERWYPSKAEEEATAGYGPLGSLLRAGPKPFLQRILSPEQYDQAVLKYMALDKCSRNEAQGNMDAYFENPIGLFVFDHTV